MAKKQQQKRNYVPIMDTTIQYCVTLKCFCLFALLFKKNLHTPVWSL